jgi:hypothetical protein
VQGDASHFGQQGGGQEKNNRKKWRAEEEERHKGSLVQKSKVKRAIPLFSIKFVCAGTPTRQQLISYTASQCHFFRRHMILKLLELTYLDTRPVSDKVWG